MRSARFENEAGPYKNQEGRPNGSPRTKNSKYLGMYNTGRPSNFRLGLRSPNVERNCSYTSIFNNCICIVLNIIFLLYVCFIEVLYIIKYSLMVIRFQAIWLVRWSPVISSYSSDWLYMENAWLVDCHVTFDSSETQVIFESAASSDTIYFQINICRWKIICCCI